MTTSFSAGRFSALLMGDESLTIACGDLMLSAGHQINAVITRDAQVSEWAAAHGLTVVSEPGTLTEGADWFLSIANLRMIPEPVLALGSKGAVNFHDGPLPAYAGLNTPAWAIINSEARHGVSWHVMEGGVDEGDLIAALPLEIADNETAFTLNSKCYAAGMESFSTVLAQLEQGALNRTAQDLTKRRYFGRDDRPADWGQINFDHSAAAISALVRGLDFGAYWNPLTTAKLCLGKTWIAVARATPEGRTEGPSGSVIDVGADNLVVACADGAVALSGLTDLRGQPVDLKSLVAPGDLLPVRRDVTDHQLALLKVEPYWRATLGQFDPLAVPLTSVEPGSAEPRAIEFSGHFDEPELIAIAALVAQRAAGAEMGDLAFGIGANGPQIVPWAPLRVTGHRDQPFAEVVESISDQLNLIGARGGFALDLPMRDPAISNTATPHVAVTTDGAALPGADLTIALSAGKATLITGPARMDAAAVALLADRLEAAFLAAASRTATCGEIWALPARETAMMLEAWNATSRSYDRNVTIQAAFEAQVSRTPDAAALVFEDETLSYAALNMRANQLAQELRSQGVATGVTVALCTRRGPDLLIGALAILKAGGAYLPLDPSYPSDRIAHYIKDSGAPVILVQQALAPTLPKTDAKHVSIEGVQSAEDDPGNPESGAGPDDLAYLIYTSGSTGVPKGVMVSHGNVANFFAGMDDRIEHAAGDVWLAVTSLSFDISVLELFWTIARGFKLVLAGDDSRTMLSNGPVAASDRHIDFNLFYWGNDDGIGPEKYRLLLEGAKFADAHGFNAVWTPERHFHAFGGPYPNPSVTGAAVAAVTQNLAVRAGSCVAPLHHPARIAEEWAVIDNLTNGRVGLAIASGWQPDDFVLRPENTPPENKPAMYQAIDQLRQLWKGEAVDFPTKDGTPFAVVTQPRPVSETLPVWVTTAGNPRTWKEAGEIGANVLTHLLGQSIDEVAEKITIYHEALRTAGHDPADFKVTVMLHTFLADTREHARDISRGPMKDYLRAAAGLIKQYAWAFPAFKKPQGVSNPFEIDLETLSPEEMDAILEFAFERYFNDSGLFGTIEDGLARADQLRRIGVDEIACLIDYGIDVPTVMEGLKPLAKVLERANSAGTLADDDFSLAGQIVRHGVTHMQCTPSMAQMLVADDDARGALRAVRHLMVGGEALPASLAAALKKATSASLQNMYGPTETTIWSTTQLVESGLDTTSPIGKPIANTQVYVVDAQLAPAPMGVPGELLIGGDGVTQGYWQRDELTAERFVKNPFGAGRLYRTGDLVSWTPDGALQFMGRTDQQVKIRGHRIELGEIETRLAALPGVSQAVVITREDQLVGYVVASASIPEESALEALAADLPEIMIPTRIVTLDAMPLTPNKKIDRKALPDPAPRKHRQGAEAPTTATTDTQAAIAAVWSRILGVQGIRADDNFFALGGHSLLAVQAHREIKTALDAVKLSITDIFRFPTLEGLAGHLEAGPAGSVAEPELMPAIDVAAKTDTMSKRRAMRAGRSKAGG